MKMAQIQSFLHLFLPLAIFSLVLNVPSYVSADGLYFAQVAPLTKDTNTSLYSITLNSDEHYVIDLEGPFLWYNCSDNSPSVELSSPECLAARSSPYPLCPDLEKSVQNPLTCPVMPVNPVTFTCTIDELTYKPLVINWTNGLNPAFTISMMHSFVSCAPQALFKSLPLGSSGMAGLSRAALALPTQFTPKHLEVKRIFSICLPSSNVAPGLVYFGDGPVYLSSSSKKFDVTSILSYTPLLNETKNLGYYIGLKGIYIGGKPSHLPTQTLEFDNYGRGGAKISTTFPYTILRSDIYRVFLANFKMATKEIPKAKKFGDFDLCLDTSKLGSTATGLNVPKIEFELAGGKKWTIFGSNSMKQVSKNVACLAFLNGGDADEVGVIIGSFQLENNFLFFDLVESRLGFSSSLLNVGTSCSNFNFTTQF